MVSKSIILLLLLRADVFVEDVVTVCCTTRLVVMVRLVVMLRLMVRLMMRLMMRLVVLLEVCEAHLCQQQVIL